MRLTVACLAVALMSPSLAAADPPSVSATDWSGCYAGITAGGVFSGKSSKSNSVVFGTNVFAAQPSNTSFNGAIGGVDVGCNVQLSTNPTLSKIVFGPELEGWAQNVSGKSDVSNTRSPGETIRSSLESSFAGVAAFRLGYAYRNFLFYAKGGAAFTTVKYRGYISDDMSGQIVDKTINTKTGAIGSLVGAGAEVALPHHLSAKLEYDYIDFGKTKTTYEISLDPGLPTNGFLTGPSISSDTENVIKASLVYKFF